MSFDKNVSFSSFILLFLPPSPLYFILQRLA